MWYLASLFLLIALLSSCVIIGTAVCRLLPPHIQPYATFAFAPLMGLAVFVLLATATAWIAGFQTWFCLPATIALVLVALRLSGNPGKALKAAAAVSAYAVLPSLAWFFSILRFEAFSPFNDTLAYITHAQWLQTHSFRETAKLSENYPGLAHIISNQVQGFRIGASCVLGWVQAACGVQWSYLVYPAVVTLAMVAGAWALAGTAFFVVRRGRLLCLLGGAAIVTTFNGFSFGANEGFFHQTYGTALGFATLSLLGMYMAVMRRRRPIMPRQLIPGALLAAATVFSYPEFAPFLALGAAAFLAGAVLLRLARPITIARFALVLCLLTVAFVNLELIRTFRSLFNDTHAVVGSPVVWTPIKFLAHTCGFLTGAWEGGDWVFSSPLLTAAVLLLFIGSAAFLLLRYRQRIRLEGLAPALCVAGACFLAFLYFRYFSKSPWPQGVGQSWNQFKLSNWAAIFVMFILVCGLASAKYAPRWAQYLVIAWLLVWQMDGLALNYRMAEARTWQMRTETGVNRAPFDVYRQICEAAVLKPGEPVSLQLGPDHFKSREMFVYFWPDRPLISDWFSDDYFAAAGFKGNAGTAEPSMWTVELSTPGPMKLTEQRVGRISLLRPPLQRIQLLQVTGGYDEDSDSAHNSLRWTAKRLIYHFKQDGSLRLHANFTYLPSSPGRQLRILVDEGTPRILQSVDMQHAWTQFVTTPFEVHSAEFNLIFECDQPPVRLGNGDPRMASFLIKNLELNVVE
jgi:hypothetical protein